MVYSQALIINKIHMCLRLRCPKQMFWRTLFPVRLTAQSCSLKQVYVNSYMETEITLGDICPVFILNAI